jgi:hypothetical protein
MGAKSRWISASRGRFCAIDQAHKIQKQTA